MAATSFGLRAFTQQARGGSSRRVDGKESRRFEFGRGSPRRVVLRDYELAAFAAVKEIEVRVRAPDSLLVVNGLGRGRGLTIGTNRGTTSRSMSSSSRFPAIDRNGRWAWTCAERHEGCTTITRRGTKRGPK
jgi:hypothetical protein